MNPEHRQEGNEIAARLIIAVLEQRREGVLGEELADLVLREAELEGHAWKRSTAARRVREALQDELLGDQLVITVGEGYKLARYATPEELARAAELSELKAGKHSRRAERIRTALERRKRELEAMRQAAGRPPLEALFGGAS